MKFFNDLNRFEKTLLLTFTILFLFWMYKFFRFFIDGPPLDSTAGVLTIAFIDIMIFICYFSIRKITKQ